jgi:hypothetical protein
MLHSSGHAFIRGYLQCSPNTNYQSVLFLIDTGCSVTTLLPTDVARLSINCTLLQATTGNVGTASGIIHPYIYPNPELRLKVNYGWFNRKATFAKPPLDFIYCIPPPPIWSGYSTIGQDILHYFKKWVFTDTELILQS